MKHAPYWDKPSSDGMSNVLRRAAQLARLRWTPLARMPMTAPVQSEQNEREPFAYFSPWRPQTGLPYSSVRLEEKFIGFNVSIETFMTALANPQSVLYTRNLTGRGLRMSCWYGTVCSAFVSYALGLPCRRPCSEWGKHGDMSLAELHSGREVGLCDILCSERHAALVTGVSRNGDGSVHSVVVTECTRPLTVRTEFTAREFERHWLRDYRVYRYHGIERVGYTPSPYVPLEGDPESARPDPNATLLPDYGNRANYRLGEPVALNVMEPGWESLAVAGPDEAVWEQPLAGPGVLRFVPRRPGFYRACCLRGVQKSEPVEFAVVEPRLRLAAAPTAGRPPRLEVSLAPGDRLACCIVANASDGFTVHNLPLCEERAPGPDLELPPLPHGAYHVKVLARNRFGLYASAPLPLEL